MTFLVHPPRPIAIRTDAHGVPRHLGGGFLNGELNPVERWIAEVDWWSRPVSREYWRVLLRRPGKSGELLCEIFRDLREDGWYVQRVYD